HRAGRRRAATRHRAAPRARSSRIGEWRARRRPRRVEGAGGGTMIRRMALVVVIVAAAALLIRRGVSAAAPRSVATGAVQRGRVQTTVYTVGDLRASRAMQLAVPPMGGQLQILSLAETGDAVKTGDIVLEFDAAEQEFNLEQARFDLQLAEQDI